MVLIISFKLSFLFFSFNEIKFLYLFTDININEIKKYESLDGSNLNKIKVILANEVTKVCHGEKESKDAEQEAKKILVNKILRGRN